MYYRRVRLRQYGVIRAVLELFHPFSERRQELDVVVRLGARVEPARNGTVTRRADSRVIMKTPSTQLQVEKLKETDAESAQFFTQFGKGRVVRRLRLI